MIGVGVLNEKALGGTRWDDLDAAWTAEVALRQAVAL